MAHGVESGAAAEASVGPEYTGTEHVAAQNQPEEIVAHEEQKRGV